jgi:hypothetical protein
MGEMTKSEATARVKTKEEKTSSPSQQPTSGTYPNPNPSLFLTGGIVSLSLTASPHSPSLSETVSQFQPEKRLTPVVGFRSWNAISTHKLGVGPSWVLLSLNHGIHLKLGRNEAGCAARNFLSYPGQDRLGPHTSPDATCSCGFYVMNDIDAVPFGQGGAQSLTIHPAGNATTRPAVMVAGAVVGWGRVVQHADEGWRAQYIQLIALLDCKVSDDHLRTTNEIAEAYGVPVVERKALELMAKEYGESLAVAR